MQTFVTVREEEVVKQSECKLTFLQKKGEVVTEGECVWCVFHSYFVQTGTEQSCWYITSYIYFMS